MQFITTFFRTLFKSSFEPAYYSHVLKAPMSFSWKYFLAFNALAALVTGLTLMIPVALIDIAGNIAKGAQIFPSDLVVTGNQAGLSINQDLPYQIAVPREWTADDEADLSLVTFTSDEAISGIEDVRELNSVVVLTSSTIYLAREENNQEVRVYPMPEFSEPFTVDRATIDGIIQRVAEHPFLKYKLYIPFLLVFALVFIYPLMMIGRLITLAIYTSLAWAVVSVFLKSKKLSWTQVFQISLHSITPIILIAYALGLLSFFIFHGWLYFIAYLAWTLVVINSLRFESSKSGQVGASVESKTTRGVPARTPRSKSSVKKTKRASS